MIIDIDMFLWKIWCSIDCGLYLAKLLSVQDRKLEAPFRKAKGSLGSLGLTISKILSVTRKLLIYLTGLDDGKTILK